MMADMVRKQIYLERRQVRAVRERAGILGINESELIRQAIDRDLYGNQGLPNLPDPAAWDRIEALLSAQADKTLTGEPYQFNRDELYEDRLNQINGTDSD